MTGRMEAFTGLAGSVRCSEAGGGYGGYPGSEALLWASLSQSLLSDSMKMFHPQCRFRSIQLFVCFLGLRQYFRFLLLSLNIKN